MKLLRLIRRRIFEFFWGPYTGFDGFRRRERNARKERTLNIIPTPVPLRWYEHEGLHFSRVGIVEIDWLAWTVGLYWIDNN